MGERIEYRTEFDYSDMVRRISEQVSRLIDEQAVEQVRAKLAELGYRKCSECKERQGYYLDAETIQRQQEHIAELEAENAKLRRMNENIGAELANFGEQRDKAVAERDELIRDLYDNLWTHVPKCAEAFAERMRAIGIEVDYA